DEEEITYSGIVLPDTAKEKPQRGKVLAVGPGRYEDGKLVALDVKKGDEIIFSKYGGTEVKLSGDEYLILRESGILAKGGSSKGAAKAEEERARIAHKELKFNEEARRSLQRGV